MLENTYLHKKSDFLEYANKISYGIILSIRFHSYINDQTKPWDKSKKYNADFLVDSFSSILDFLLYLFAYKKSGS